MNLVLGSKDAPRQKQIADLATILYGLQMGLLLFWFQDLTPETRRTTQMLGFVHDSLSLLRPVMGLPPVASLLARLVRIIGPMLGADER